MKTLIACWLFVLGGVVGSFLNVVIYRLPAGKSLVRPGSHCPICGHPIRWYDNVPIFGWFLLGGRCRDCHATISARYPIVEALTAGLFAMLAVVEGLSGGANLPLRPVPVIDGVIFPPITGSELGWVVAYHLLLLCTLIAAAGIEYDRQPIPGHLAAPTILVGWLLPAMWPNVHPVPVWPGLEGWIAGLCDGTAGLAAGAALGLVVWRTIGAKENLGLIAGPACVGLFLGWQAGVAVIIVASLVYLPFHLFARLRSTAPAIPFTGWLVTTTLVWLLLWRSLVDRWPILG